MIKIFAHLLIIVLLMSTQAMAGICLCINEKTFTKQTQTPGHECCPDEKQEKRQNSSHHCNSKSCTVSATIETATLLEKANVSKKTILIIPAIKTFAGLHLTSLADSALSPSIDHTLYIPKPPLYLSFHRTLIP